MNEYDLRDLGITASVSLHGTLTQLPAGNSPIIFLFDENHGSTKCIEQNIENAKELVSKANVTLIGVESHQGGVEWDDYDECYRTDRINPGTDLQPVNGCPTFANCLRECGASVVGVECGGMLDKQHCDFIAGGEWHGRPEREHPLNIERSKHFLKTLLDFWRGNGARGNAILNAGGDHISHIMGWVNDGSAENIAGQRATYVHIRVPAFAPE